MDRLKILLQKKIVWASILVLLICLFLFFSIFFQSATKKAVPGSGETITPSSGQSPIKATKGIESEEVPLTGIPNPTYVQKIKQQPFWEELPYYTDHYKIVYKDSDDKLIITTFGRGQIDNYRNDSLKYRQEARDWLVENGAELEKLRIEYVPANL